MSPRPLSVAGRGEFPDLWSPEQPALQLVKAVVPGLRDRIWLLIRSAGRGGIQAGRELGAAAHLGQPRR